MTLDRIDLALLYLPYVHFFETSLQREEGRTFIIVKAYGDGLTGYGEVVASENPFYSYETTTTAWLVLREFFIPLAFEKGIDDPGRFTEEARRYRGHPMAKAGLELALWDLEAKRAGQPLRKLYGGPREKVPVGVSLGIENSVGELLDRIGSFLGEGYSRIKIKIKPGWDVEVVREVRARFPDIPLQADANGAYSPKDAAKLKALDDFGLLMLEQPFPPYDLWDHSRLQTGDRDPALPRRKHRFRGLRPPGDRNGELPDRQHQGRPGRGAGRGPQDPRHLRARGHPRLVRRDARIGDRPGS